MGRKTDSTVERAKEKMLDGDVEDGLIELIDYADTSVRNQTIRSLLDEKVREEFDDVEVRLDA